MYETCGSVCERTCHSLSGMEPGCKGEKACEEGCFCPAGKYLSDSGECVAAELCTCLHDGELYQPNDIYADHNSIWSVILKGPRRFSCVHEVSFLTFNSVTVRRVRCTAAHQKRALHCLTSFTMMTSHHPEVQCEPLFSSDIFLK